MLEFKIKDSKGNNTTMKCPNCWEDVTTLQYMRLTNCNQDNFIEVFSALTGMSIEDLDACTDSKLHEHLYPAIEFIYSDFLVMADLDMPSHISIDDFMIEVPKELGQKTFGQRAMCDRYRNEDKSTNSCLAKVMAVYLEPIYREHKIAKNNKIDIKDLTELQLKECQFSSVRAEEFAIRCLDIPIMQVFPIVSFFLSS